VSDVTVRTWGRAFGAIAAAAGTWLTALTSLESDLAAGLRLSAETRFGVAAILTILAGAAV
jgi:hypothetical protein